MANRIQREIEDILSRLEGFPPKRPWRSRLRDVVRRIWRGLRSLPATLPRPHISLGQVMLVGGVLIIVAYVADFEGSLYRGLLAAGLVLFFLAFLLSLRRRASVPEKHWRGQPMELHSGGVGDRLRSWWERWRSRR